MLDYRDLDDAEDIAGRPPINITYAGRKTAADKTRKWTPWTIAANACALVERSDGTAVSCSRWGNARRRGRRPDGPRLSTERRATLRQWHRDSELTTRRTISPSVPSSSLSTSGAHRKLFSYLTMFVEGAGNLSLTQLHRFTERAAVRSSRSRSSSPSTKDLELPINVLGERVAFQVSTNQAGRMVPPAKIYALGPRRSLGASERYELILPELTGNGNRGMRINASRMIGPVGWSFGRLTLNEPERPISRRLR